MGVFAVKNSLVWVLLSVLMVGQSAAQAGNESLSPQNNQLSVLVSVHPMALLIKSAWPDLDVQSLMPANQSPHDFSLKPSDRRRVLDSQVLIWLGPEIEPYLASLATQVKQGVLLDGYIPESDHDQQGHMDEHAHEHVEHAHQAPAHDPHVWLMPEAIPSILLQIQSALKLPKPQAFLNAYQATLASINSQLAPHRQQGFVSFHDAFHFWVAYFQLNQLAMVSEHPEKPVGTRHILDVRQILSSGKAACLFVEPQFQSRLLNKLSQGLDIKMINIDPMASNYRIEHANFIGFYETLAQQFTACIKP